MLSLSDFVIERIVFEARYPQNFLLWDRSGELWTQLGRLFPALTLVTAQPNNTQFETDGYSLLCSADALRITCKGEISFSSFKEAAASFFDSCVQTLRIDKIDRLGLRVIFAREYKAIGEAAEAAFSFGKLLKPSSDFFKTDGVPNLVDWRLSWQGSTVGVQLMVRTEDRKVNAQLPWELRSVATISVKNFCALVIDADYFTTAPLYRDQVSADEWLRSSDRSIRKGIEKELFND
jgi:hypothetical protein